MKVWDRFEQLRHFFPCWNGKVKAEFGSLVDGTSRLVAQRRVHISQSALSSDCFFFSLKVLVLRQIGSIDELSNFSDT